MSIADLRFEDCRSQISDFRLIWDLRSAFCNRPVLTGFLVDEVLQFLARLEIGDALGRHVHLVAGLRVAALAGLALAKAETAEAAQLDLLTAFESLDDALEHGVDDHLTVLLGEVRYARDFFDQFGLR